MIPGRRRLLCALAAITTLSLLPGRPRAAGERFLRIGTGPTGASYFPVGSLIASLLSSPPGAASCDLGGSCGVPGVIAAAAATQGSVANIGELARNGFDLAICQADIARDAIEGSGPFAGKPVPQLRAIASLFTEALHVVVRSEDKITSLPDLRRKRVSLGERESGTLPTARLVLRADKVAEQDLVVSHDPLVRAATALARGKLDAFFMVGGYPLEVIARLAETMPIALIAPGAPAVESLTTAASTLRPVVIPAGIYDGVGATATLGPRALLLTTTALENDLAYAITRSLWDNRNRRLFESGPPLNREIRLPQALDGLTVPLHPGAARFYLENGMTLPGGR